jgi:hypothetical protein
MPTPRDTPGVLRVPIQSLYNDKGKDQPLIYNCAYLTPALVPASPTIAKGKARAPVPVVLDDFSSDEDSDEDQGKYA